MIGCTSSIPHQARPGGNDSILLTDHLIDLLIKFDSVSVAAPNQREFARAAEDASDLVRRSLPFVSQLRRPMSSLSWTRS
jgi:hypothetical protein